MAKEHIAISKRNEPCQVQCSTQFWVPGNSRKGWGFSETSNDDQSSTSHLVDAVRLWRVFSPAVGPKEQYLSAAVV